MTDALRRRNGRPQKSAAERRAERLPDIRVTATERVAIEGKAAQAGLVVTEFMRRAALGQRVHQPPAAASDAVLYELNRIGNNLNQITARMHLTGELSHSLPDTLAELRRAMMKVAGLGP